MNKNIIRTLAIALALAHLGAAQARSNYIPRTERGRLAEQIVRRWALEGAKQFQTTPRGWADAMASAFARAPLHTMRRASTAATFERMAASFASPTFLATADAGDLVFRSLTPCRIVDTRATGGAGGEKLVANMTRTFDGKRPGGSFKDQGGIDADCGIPGEAVALSMQITSTQQDGVGHLRVFPAGQTMPNASALNYTRAVDIANEVPMGLGEAGNTQFNVFTVRNTHLVVDVVGYYLAAPVPEPDPAPIISQECSVTSESIKEIPDTGGVLPMGPPPCPQGKQLISVFCHVGVAFPGGSHARLRGVLPTGCLFEDSAAGDLKTGLGVASARCCKVTSQ